MDASILQKRSSHGVAKRATARERVFAASGAAVFLAVLIVAWGLAPDRSGVGTHEQLGLAPCAWITIFDAPCPTCGMTTSFSYAAHAEYAGAFHAQPLGAAMAIGSAVVFWSCLHVAIFGSRIGAFAGPLLTGWGVRLFVIALIGAWVYKLTVHVH